MSPTSRRNEAALPPTATAVWTGGGAIRSSRPLTRSLTASSSAGVGGSLAKWASARNPEPTLNDFHHSTPSAIVPMAISLEPPPTSTTAIRPSSGCPSVRVAPRKARRASSSPSSTHTSTPPWRSISAQNSSRFAALRMTAVATVRIAAAPAWRASATCSATTVAVSAIRVAGIVPPAVNPRPSRVKARRCSTSVRTPSCASATSTRVVFVPISMQPQSMRAPAMLP